MLRQAQHDSWLGWDASTGSAWQWGKEPFLFVDPTTPLCRPDRPSFVISTEVERSLHGASVKNSLMGWDASTGSAWQWVRVGCFDGLWVTMWGAVGCFDGLCGVWGGNKKTVLISQSVQLFKVNFYFNQLSWLLSNETSFTTDHALILYCIF